jgi:hypothetical protein
MKMRRMRGRAMSKWLEPMEALIGDVLIAFPLRTVIIRGNSDPKRNELKQIAICQHFIDDTFPVATVSELKDEIIRLYHSHIPITTISRIVKHSRKSIYDLLKKEGIDILRRVEPTVGSGALL